MKEIITMIGFLAVGYVFFALVGKNGGITTLADKSSTTEIAEAGMYDAAVERPLERPSEVSRNKRSSNQELAIVAPATTSKSTAASAGQLRREVEKLADLAISSALDQKNKIPAGASLTLLIMSAERGKQLSESNLLRVVQLLHRTKTKAPQEDQQYFKYTSNSEKWFEGLQIERNGGYNIGDLLRIYDQYNLRKYDQDVMAMVSSDKITYTKKYEPATVAPAMKGDASSDEVRRNQAFAKNRWVEKESSGTEAELKFVATKEKDESSASVMHRKVAMLRVGESLTFDTPDEYHAALKELIAMENGFSSWKNYEAEMGKDQARRAFRKRSEKGGFFSSGGLKVTREN